MYTYIKFCLIKIRSDAGGLRHAGGVLKPKMEFEPPKVNLLHNCGTQIVGYAMDNVNDMLST